MTSRRIQFGDFLYQSDSGRLSGPTGEHSLRPQLARLLEYLLDHPGEVIERDRVARAVWGEDRVVEFEAGLAALVKELRSILGDSARQPRYLETIPRRGLRWLVPPQDSGVQAGPPTDSFSARPAAKRGRRIVIIGLAFSILLTGALGLVILTVQQAADEASVEPEPRAPRVAVLPFLAIDEADRERRASLLLADSTIAALASVVSSSPNDVEEAADHPFAVIGRTSITGYPAGDGLAAALAEDLGVDLVVEGSYRREGDVWLITVSVVKVREQTILLSRSFLVPEPSSRAAREHLQGFAIEMAAAVRRCGEDCLVR